jgi:hypothetical protein
MEAASLPPDEFEARYVDIDELRRLYREALDAGCPEDVALSLAVDGAGHHFLQEVVTHPTARPDDWGAGAASLEAFKQDLKGRLAG